MDAMRKWAEVVSVPLFSVLMGQVI